MTRNVIFRLFRVSCEEAFTTEAPRSQSSENFLNKNLFPLRPPRLRGAISEFCFTKARRPYFCSRRDDFCDRTVYPHCKFFS